MTLGKLESDTPTSEVPVAVLLILELGSPTKSPKQVAFLTLANNMKPQDLILTLISLLLWVRTTPLNSQSTIL